MLDRRLRVRGSKLLKLRETFGSVRQNGFLIIVVFAQVRLLSPRIDENK